MDSYKSPKLEIRNTNNCGLGVFAKEDILKGQTIHILKGEIISLVECIRRVNEGEEIVDDPLQIALELYLDLDEFSRAFNHSCAPNAGLRNRSELFAIRDIQTGEEITFDYSATVGPNITLDMWSMVCTCDNEHCRKQIGNILSLPYETLARYKKEGALQDYMKRVLANLGKDADKTIKK